MKTVASKASSGFVFLELHGIFAEHFQSKVG